MRTMPVFQRFTSLILGLYIFSTTLAILTVSGLLPIQFPFTPVNTILAFTFGIMHASQRLGWSRSALLVIFVFLTDLAFESVGVATGLIYGPYHYTDQLGPKFLGLVPYIIPIAWFMMIYPSYVIAERLSSNLERNFTRLLVIAAVGGLIMTAWDLSMDPYMIRGGNWVWDGPGAYFGVPVQNFWGWWLTTFVALAIFQLLPRQRAITQNCPIPDHWIVILYGITGLSTIVVDFIIDLPGPALVGFFAMGPWILYFWFSKSKQVI
jgi:uncharacterized membrane protein